MALKSFSLDYTTDRGKSVSVVVKYDDESNLTPQQRLSRGGFQSNHINELSCAIAFARSDLMPRYIDFVEGTAGGSNNPKRVRVFYRTHSAWVQGQNNNNALSAQGERLNCRALKFTN